MKKVLITGASGLLGKAVLRQLEEKKEYEVYAVTTKQENLIGYNHAHITLCDLSDEVQRDKIIKNIAPDILIHLAWNQENSDFRMSEENLKWLNISMELLYSFEKYGGKRFLFAGSSSEYDGANGVFDESADIVPSTLYGLCKKTFNDFANQYCRVRNIDYVGMRLFTIYGREDRHSFGAIPSAIHGLIHGEKIICNSPNTTRDYIYAEDAAHIVVQLMEHTYKGILNVASGIPRNMREVFECIGKSLNQLENIRFNEENMTENRFEADISLMKQLGLTGYNSCFEKNIDDIVKGRLEMYRRNNNEIL